MATFFTLRFTFSLVWMLLLVGIALVGLDGLQRQALVALATGGFFLHLASAGQVLLIRRVHHRRLAVLDIVTTFLTFIVTLALAWQSHSIWALVVMPWIQALVLFAGLSLWRPVWRPRFAWDLSAMRYFLDFGARTVGGNVLHVALERVDDLWTGFFLGSQQLGYYSRAYRFAVYPRLILSEPVNSIATGMYAALKNDRRRLSRAFFQMNAFLARAGFLLAGMLALVAPEFIHIFLGERWLPMLPAFRLMLIFTLLDPLKVSVSGLLTAVGRPEQASLARLAQLVVMLVGLFTLGFRYSIQGVALAVDVMLVVGMALAFHYVRPYVDFSGLRLFLAPMVGLLAGFGLAWWALALLPAPISPWLTGAVKIVAYGSGYAAVLAALEGRLLIEQIRELRQWIR